MEAVRNIFRFLGMGVFFLSIALFLLTVLNNWFGFASATWLSGPFWRVYLFFAVSGILLYILITFRRKKDD
ncbi:MULTISPECIES: hypothetical protein [unclassified Planococcus (in: firmicutes)]|uniref:hypothetical protein n=1 Tax=Planococcus TaxID=1372 RepID=UPI000C321981|nr:MULTISPECIES: hypothetical protein [unclassified Planococcus (in: firmicutes)]AUD14826.1 hypothetical protein CW734_15585 [Planococcus sp. MB-3u-03]PKG45147.1 hypothetical protein CXF66_15130 [Planococcus sp. Urea-trap-24]PKG87489.1 hypothetical protein CXF91_15975 [Planococcus sp. Urea-3u-39]PKH42614.1 hypothetical protein CXF77_04685 [Planococcus sp. MB-3u-09]